MIIAIEGLSGSGKSTFLNYMKINYPGADMVYIDEVTDKSLDGWSNALLCHDTQSEQTIPFTQVFIFLTYLTYTYEKYMLPALQAGKIVVVDRYKATTCAYQACIAAYVTGLEKQVILEWIEQTIAFLPNADYTVFLEVDKNTAISRMSHDDCEREESRLSLFNLEIIDDNFRLELVETYKQLVTNSPCVIKSSHNLDKAELAQTVFSWIKTAKEDPR